MEQFEAKMEPLRQNISNFEMQLKEYNAEISNLKKESKGAEEKFKAIVDKVSPFSLL